MITDKKYQIIYADPPWQQTKGGKKNVRKLSSGEPLKYPVISLEEIRRILFSVRLKYADSPHCLFMWTIDKYLYESEKMAKEIGYELHARMIWNKVTGIPAAFTIRFGHEYLLWFYTKPMLKIAKAERGKIHSVFTEQVKRHSQKPEIAYQIIERIYSNATKLELFARKKRDGWDSWGNEVESDLKLEVA